LHTLKHLLTRYIALVWALLKPLGAWGVFAIAAIDSAFLGIPLDPVVAGYVFQDRPRFLLYAVLASAGSAAGGAVLYLIGYKGGEVLLQNRMSRTKFNNIRQAFDRHEFWALMFPSMIPPPFPFKLVALAASVFEMNFWHFLLAIFAGRMVRFLILSVLVLTFGPQVVALATVMAAKHWLLTLLSVAAAAGLWLWAWRATGRHRSEAGELRKE
jgi:membrane protein YqaA with SNARE-associated domain